MSEYYREAVQTALEEAGVSLAAVTSEQWDEVGASVASWAENAWMYSAPTPSRAEVQEINESRLVRSLRMQLADSEARESVYKESVARRRNANEVWVEDGNVMYR